MEKKLEEMNEQELLRELVARHDRQKFVGWIAAAAVSVLAIGLLISAVILVPRFVRTLKQADATLAQANTTLTETKALVQQGRQELTAVDALVKQAGESLEGVDGMVENIDKLVQANTESLTETVEKLNAVDFEKLAKAIDDLSKVISPLSKLFGRS